MVGRLPMACWRNGRNAARPAGATQARDTSSQTGGDFRGELMTPANVERRTRPRADRPFTAPGAPFAARFVPLANAGLTNPRRRSYPRPFARYPWRHGMQRLTPRSWLMGIRIAGIVAALALVASAAGAQQNASSPVSNSIRRMARGFGRNIVSAAESMPAD